MTSCVMQLMINSYFWLKKKIWKEHCGMRMKVSMQWIVSLFSGRKFQRTLSNYSSNTSGDEESGNSPPKRPPVRSNMQIHPLNLGMNSRVTHHSRFMQPRYHGQRAVSIPLITNCQKRNTENQRWLAYQKRLLCGPALKKLCRALFSTCM